MSLSNAMSTPWVALSVATALLLAALADAHRDPTRPWWLRLGIRIVVFAAITLLLQHSVGVPASDLTPLPPGLRIWAQLAEVAWWMLGARVAVGILRVIVVLEGRPHETQIVSDLLAGAIYTATALAVINYVFEVPIGGLIATSGVIAIVLGLALQSTLSDVFSGIAMGLEHAYKPGDVLWVEGGIEGTVLQITWRSTQIATPHNSIAVVPNSVIAKSRLENRSAPTPTRSVTIPVTIDARIDPRRCIEALQAAAQACRIPLSSPKPAVNCVGLQGDGNLFQVRFTVGMSRDIEAARTEALTLIHRHLRSCGIGLGAPGVDPLPAAPPPTLADVIADSDLLGALPPDQRALFADHFEVRHYDAGAIMVRQGETPDAVFLIARGTVDVTRTDAQGTRILLRASPADSIAGMALMTGMPSLFTATALTPVLAYRLDRASIAAMMRIKPELTQSLEAQAKRGNAWIRCETEAHVEDNHGRPEMLLVRLRQFLRKLNAGV
ncbi:MAG TPA: mechanosensitive ion channel family protein [Rhodopila sp.]|uniref:mechanosensitive ion channel family protein n=1 Tax=Rhodopila sp. TaxID=2480087 RepID=UPI002D028FB1|nr:mechanosensitive ion channel family protein [Rhodopila sp.]HVY14664.1 mechanosensitive ion channel family protein [Rhodopila sp.]